MINKKLIYKLGVKAFINNKCDEPIYDKELLILLKGCIVPSVRCAYYNLWLQGYNDSLVKEFKTIKG